MLLFLSFLPVLFSFGWGVLFEREDEEREKGKSQFYCMGIVYFRCEVQTVKCIVTIRTGCVWGS